MPILSGQVVTADDLNHLKPTTYQARASATLNGIVVNADVVGATITLTTETDNAVFVVSAAFDFRWTGIAALTATGNLSVDGVLQSGQAIAGQNPGASADRMTAGNVWRGTLATAGSHTLKLVGSLPDTDQHIEQPHTALVVVIYEVV